MDVNRAMHGMHVDRNWFGGWCVVRRGERGRKIRCGTSGKGKNVLVKCYVARNDHATGLRIETSVPFVGIRKTKRDAGKRARRELVRSGGGHIRETKTAKNAEIVIRGRGQKERIVGREARATLGGTNVEEMCGMA